MTGRPDVERPADPDVPDGAGPQQPDLVDRAVGEAFAAGMRVTRPDDGPWRAIVCPRCEVGLELPAEALWPVLLARRIRAFVVRHRHAREEAERDR